LIGAIAIAVLLAAAVTLVVTRTPPRPTYPGQASGPGGVEVPAPVKVTVTVPPALPGEPPIGADRETMLAKFAANISGNLYTRSNLLFLVCNAEAGRTVANQAGDPMTMALMRRMVLLFRSAPGMAQATCPATPPQTP
jgi:hypothetical protein